MTGNRLQVTGKVFSNCHLKTLEMGRGTRILRFAQKDGGFASGKLFACGEPDGKVPSLQRDWKLRGVGDAGPLQ